MEGLVAMRPPAGKTSPRRARPPPPTYFFDPLRLSDNLDFTEMIALAEAFTRWATTSTTLSPADCTQLIQWAADLEMVASWCESGWIAPYPEYPETMLKAAARKLLFEDSARSASLDRFFTVSEWRW